MVSLLKNIAVNIMNAGFEVVVDAPYRIEPGMSIPLICLVKEKRNKSFTIESIKVNIMQKGQTIRVTSVLRSPVDVHDSKWHKVIRVPLHDSMQGKFELDTIVTISRDGKNKKIRSHPYSGTSSETLKIFRAVDSLPKFADYYFGDMHYHCLSESKSESISAPLMFSTQVAKAFGLQFFAATDHAYVLDDNGGSSRNDNSNKWDKFQEKVDSINSKNEDVVILPGEEIKCKNHRGRDVDLIIVNYPEFIRGSQGTTAPVKSHESNLKELLSRVESAAVTFAVHPMKQTSFYEKLFYRRGRWGKLDLTLAGLTGMQVYDGMNEYFLGRRLKHWVELLLKGERKYIVAGSDSYADFGERVKPQSPFKKSNTKSIQEFGRARTGLFCTQPITKEKIVQSLKEGKSVISTGPLMDFSVHNHIGKRVLVGGNIEGRTFTVKFRGVSSAEYGPITDIKLYLGEIRRECEEQVFSVKLTKNRYNYQGEFHIEARGKINYIRGELISGDAGRSLFCVTNPIWIKSLT